MNFLNYKDVKINKCNLIIFFLKKQLFAQEQKIKFILINYANLKQIQLNLEIFI